MAFIKFRGSTVTPPKPTSTGANNAPLTNAELDGNLRSINDSLETTVTELTSLTSTVNTKANIASPTFTGTVGGITKGMVGLGNVDNTADVNKNVLSSVTSDSTRTVQTPDTRAVAIPPNYGVGVKTDLKLNTTDGLNDGGTLHGVMTFQQFTDATGGGTRQLGFTDNNNLWIRGSGSALTAFGSWKQILDSTSFTSFAPTLTGGGASGSWNITSALATNLTGGSGGQVLYQSAAGVTTRLPNGNIGQYLAANGGTAAPSWATVTIPTVNNGSLTGAATAPGATNTTVVTNFSGAYSANSASNVTLRVLVGPALTNLATAMTGAGTGYLRKTGVDTYSVDVTTINDGALTIPAPTAGATNTTIGISLSGSYSANSSTNRSIDSTIGPALTNLAAAMTGAGTGMVRKTGQDTYIISGNADTATALSAGADRTKLDGIANNANNYSHPANHPPSIITQDASNRFVTDAEKAAWNAKQAAGNYATGGGTATGINTGDQDLSGKQNVLVSGTNIKTVGGTTLLGSGNLDVGNADFELLLLAELNDTQADVTGLQSKRLFGSFVMSLTSLSSSSSSSFTTTVTGAAVGDSVVVNPGNSFGNSATDQGCLSYVARVSAANTITVSIRNASEFTATITASTWQVAVIKP